MDKRTEITRKEVPFGCTYEEAEDTFYFCAAADCKSLSLKLYAEEAAVFPFPEENRQGNVFQMRLKLPSDGKKYSYTYLADGTEYPDPYGRRLSSRRKWGEAAEQPLRVLLPEREPRREEAEAPRMPPGHGFVYRLNVRSFTKDASSGVSAEKRGTFDGVIEKLPYLEALGVTCLELLPICEFEENLPAQPFEAAATAGGHAEKSKKEVRTNLWGFTPRAMRFSVKQAYGGREGFARLLKAAHDRGIALIVDLYFDGTEPFSYVLDVMKTWLFDYRADGLHPVGNVPIDLLLKEPCLKHTDLWYHADHPPTLYRNDFQNDMRRFLKGDAGMLPAVVRHLYGSRDGEDDQDLRGLNELHFMANTDGFTLWDVFSYHQKHNEANGEQGRDGTDENFSWNCGEEGPSRKKKVKELREQLYQNAILMTFFSAGTPLLLAGDESGHSKRGNNNSWCQDNEIEWLNWKRTGQGDRLRSFVRMIAALRSAHPVLRKKTPPRFRDWKSLGLPDVSIHGREAWKPDLSPESRQIGILYYGAYEKRADGSCDDSFYIGYNMYWEPQELALPKLPGKMVWRLLIDTADRHSAADRDFRVNRHTAANGRSAAERCDARQEPLQDQSRIRLAGRSAVVLIAEAETADNIEFKAGEE